MMWAPVQGLSEIMRHDVLKPPVFWWPQVYIPDLQDPVAMNVGERFHIELEHGAIEAEVCRINYSAAQPLQLMWKARCGSTLLNWFSPDQFLEVRPV